MTAANAAPCFDDASFPNTCSAYQGKIGDMGIVAYVDTLQVDGETYVVAADGASTPQYHLKVEIWHLSDPTKPAQAPLGGSILKFDGLSSFSRGPQLFEQAGDIYLAVLDLLAFDDTRLHVYDVSHCLDANGCQSAGSTLVEIGLPSVRGNYQFLNHSESQGRSFLYYGLEATTGGGRRIEQLFDVSALGNLDSGSDGSIFEVTETGATYIDPCNSEEVDYWGDYYSGNHYGLDNLTPRHGIFSGKYFYRAALGILDVHELAQASSQASITVSTDPDPLWMEDAVSFGSTVLGCTPGAASWCWLVEPELGANVDLSPRPGNPLTGCDVGYSAVQDFTFTCGGPGRCDDTEVGVVAWNLLCGGAAEGVQNGVAVTLKDPTVEIAEVVASETKIQECQTAQLSGTLRGRGPVSWRWELEAEPISGCQGTGFSSVDLVDVPAITCDLTAQPLDGELIMSDGFESGDCSRWNASVGGSCEASAWRAPIRVKGGDSAIATFTVWDSTTSAQDPRDHEDVELSVLPIGDPSWTSPGAPVSTQINGSQVLFVAEAGDASAWEWQFQDPTGSSSCMFPGLGTVACTRQTTISDTNAYPFPQDGSFAYRVTASNCRSRLTVTTVGTVTAEAGEQPDVIGFDLAANPATTCCGSLIGGGLKRVAGRTVSFDVTVAQAHPSFSFAFDWERSAASVPGTFGSPSSPPVSGSVYAFTHVFGDGEERVVYPMVEARSGALSDAHEWLAGASGESAFGLTILPAGNSCDG